MRPQWADPLLTPHAKQAFAVPTTDPDQGDQICVQFARSWQPLVLGALLNLIEQAVWDTTDDSASVIAQERANLLMYLFQKPVPCATVNKFTGGGGGFPFGGMMFRQNPDNFCELQVSPDGQCWCTIFDASKCFTPPGQPGEGAPQPVPGGPPECYQGTFDASGAFLIPTPVSTGDTLNVNVSGAGYDPASLLWYCPDGLEFVLGNCSGIPHFVGTDPLTTVGHYKVIFKIGSAYYDLPNGTDFTVPSGHTNDQATIIVNSAPQTGQTGTYTVKACVQSGTLVTFTHHFDFRLGTAAWQQNLFGGNSNAVWTFGSGYSSSIVNVSPLSGEGAIDLHLNLPRALSHVTLRMVGHTVQEGSNGQSLYQNTSSFPPTAIGEMYAQYATGAIDFSHAFTAVLNSLAAQIQAGNTLGDTCTLTDIYITADGTDPF